MPLPFCRPSGGATYGSGWMMAVLENGYGFGLAVVAVDMDLAVRRARSLSEGSILKCVEGRSQNSRVAARGKRRAAKFHSYRDALNTLEKIFIQTICRG